LNEFLAWLALGELLHVGKHTAWGSGWYEVSLHGDAASSLSGRWVNAGS
jgi:hypothetical protein